MFLAQSGKSENPGPSYPLTLNHKVGLTTKTCGETFPLFPLAIHPFYSNPQCSDILQSMKSHQPLNRAAIDEFKAAYAEEFGEVLSDEQVIEIATRLLRFFGILTEPLPPKKESNSPIHRPSR